MFNEWSGAWCAMFTNGPWSGEIHEWAVGPICQRLYVMPVATARGKHWVLVGDEHTPPETPWPDQMSYRLAVVNIEPGEIPTAVYALDRPAQQAG